MLNTGFGSLNGPSIPLRKTGAITKTDHRSSHLAALHERGHREVNQQAGTVMTPEHLVAQEPGGAIVQTLGDSA